MKETPRFILSNFIAYPTAAWVGTALWHWLEPPKDAWWSFPWGMTVGLLALVTGFFAAYFFYHATAPTSSVKHD